MTTSGGKPTDSLKERADSVETASGEVEPMNNLDFIILFVVLAFVLSAGLMILNLFYDIRLLGRPAYRILALPTLAEFILILVLFYLSGIRMEKEKARKKDMQLALTRVRQENTRFVLPRHVAYIRDHIFNTYLTEGLRFADAIEIFTLLEEKAEATGLEIARVRVDDIRRMVERVQVKYALLRDRTDRFLERKGLRYSAVTFFQKELERRIGPLKEAEERLASLVTAVEESIDRILRRRDRDRAMVSALSSRHSAGEEGANSPSVWLAQMEEDMVLLY